MSIHPPETPHHDDPSRGMLPEFARALVQAVEAKDPFTRRHSEHVVYYARRLGDYADLPGPLRDTLATAALLHDIGKIAVPDSILTKPGRLTRQEFAFVRLHPDTGADILRNVTLLAEEAEVVRQHHERWDGTGYPRGLRGEMIAPAGRLLHIADSLDAMLMRRTYKDGYSVPRTLRELRLGAGTQFDPELALLAARWCEQNPTLLIRPGQSAAAA
ncbi:MAG TPA: HD-GYP domain-containing protein [Phycisphaerae bacterium]|nr:HD-GYP domain-containing protein [Phycisphaerae bacterium]HUU21581.1 HD-GYP domain-containing protein [Phycisphaerae bacterium]